MNNGDRIGPYEVIAAIGAGGMGEVYRARDSKLQRDVALKVLPAGLVDDGDRASRFEREAQTLAALNHPNIATIYGFEDAAAVRALVMELVEGPTLADRIKDGPMSTEEALALALQIIDGLEAAHEQGIIHRDLKPANIKVRPDGTVKILDFGLAKVLAPLGADTRTDIANSPTITAPMMTGTGIIVGTAAYMSPEQARGRAVDKRADIWAFGCVVYEMLTASRAFAGDNTTDILAAIVQQEPDWSRLSATVPRATVALLRRCLQKNTKERLRDIGDARADLRVVFGTSEDTSGTIAHVPAPKARGRAMTFGVLGFAAGAAATGAIFLLWMSGRSAAPAPAGPTRLVVTLPPDVTLAFGRGSSVALSPDGSRLVYAARLRNGEPQLYLRALDRYESEAIAGTEGAAHPFFSPDGRWVAFFAGGRLKKVALDGGAPVVLGEMRAPRGHGWTADSGILVTPANNVGISRLPAGGGALQPFTTLAAGEMSHRWPMQVADGSAVLFTVWNDTGWEPARIVAQRAGSTEHTVVVEAGGGYPRYLHDPAAGRSYLVYARSEGLLAAGFDDKGLKLTGEAVPIVDGVATNLSGGAHFDLAADGTLAYLPATVAEGARELAWVTLDGQPAVARRFERMGRFFSLAPDGKRVLRINTVGQRDIWLEDLEGGATRRLSNGPDHFAGVWSPDSQSTVFARGAPVANIYRLKVDQPGVEERLTTSPHNQDPSDFSPDGNHIVYNDVDPATSADLWILTLSKGAAAGVSVPPPRPFLKTNFSEAFGKFSPDGRWIAYQSNESGRFEVYIRSFPDGERTLPVSLDGGIAAEWSPTGTDLYFRGTNGRLMAAAVTLSPELQVAKPRVLFDGTRYENYFEVAPDGKRLLMMPTVDTEGSATQVHVVLNFLSELRQRLR